MKKLYVIAFALLLVGWAAIAFAAPPEPVQPPPGPGWAQQGPGGPCAPHHFAPMHHRLAAFLNLSKEQKDKMRAIRNAFFADTHDLRYDIRLKRIEMRKLFTDPKTTDEALLAKQREMDMMIMKLMDRRAVMKVEMRKVLTPEQIEKLDRTGLFKFRRHGHFEG
jgi:Spy/CpxP family protein refolding chaperone